MSNGITAPSFGEIRGILKDVSEGHKIAEKEMRELRALQAETSRQMKEANEETRRQMKEANEETRQQMKESDLRMEKANAETRRQIAETNKSLKKAKDLFETKWGCLVESLVAGKLLQLLNERGIEVGRISQRAECSYKREDGQIQQKEFDIIAVNGDEVVAVEVKTTLTPGKVSYFVESLHDFRKYFKEYANKSIYGAVAYLRSDSKAHVFAQRQGLFVIRATGDSASLINTKDFKPKAFA